MACANLARFSEPPSVACTKRRVRAVIRPSCIIRAMPNNKQPCVDKRQLRHRERRGGRKVVWVGVGFTRQNSQYHAALGQGRRGGHAGEVGALQHQLIHRRRLLQRHWQRHHARAQEGSNGRHGTGATVGAMNVTAVAPIHS
eukprot:scaffold17593_cov147-Isochrysis_galbana.AAC.2